MTYPRPVARPLCLVLAWACLFLSGPWLVGAEATRSSFSIPGGDAALTLRQLSRQARESVVFPIDLVHGVQTHPVEGDFTAREAAERMVAGTDLFVSQDSQTGALLIGRRTNSNPEPASTALLKQQPPQDSSMKSLSGPASSRSSFLSVVGLAMRHVGVLAVTLAGQVSGSLSRAQSDPVGAIGGQISNAGTGELLPTARVLVEGTRLEALSDNTGTYRLLNVPPGVARVTVTYSGMATQSKTVEVSAGGTVPLDFELSRATLKSSGGQEVVTLGQYTVSERLLGAQDLAINEQRHAPNVKNVISFEEFGDLAEGNVGEYLKYTPGLSVIAGPALPESATIRGMPANGTLIMLDGALVSTPSADRSSNLMSTASGSLARVEVTKVPTPDMPANAVGGSINMVQQSGFSTKRAKLKLSTYLSFNSPNTETLETPNFNNRSGSDSRMEKRRIQPGADLSYLVPLNNSVAFTVDLSHSIRYFDFETSQQTWDQVKMIQTNNNLQPVAQMVERDLAALAVDWQCNKENSLRASFQYLNQRLFTRQYQFNSAFGANAIGDKDSTQGAATGVGSVSQTQIWGDREFSTPLILQLRYKHAGRAWKISAGASHSESKDAREDIADGFFRTVSASLSNLVLRGEGFAGINDGTAARLSAVDRSGRAVDPYDSSLYSIASVTSQPNRIKATLTQADLSVARDFSTRAPLTLKAGLSANRERKDNTSLLKTWTFSPSGGAAARLVGTYDLVADGLKQSTFASGTFRTPFLSHSKVYDLFRQHPEYFVLNEANAYISGVTNSTVVEETISAGYLRGDVKLFGNRLWLVGGFRIERTEDEGAGPSNDIRATYVQDANGNLVRNAAGQPVLVTTDPLATARLRYRERGQSTARHYQGFYPSFNLTFDVTEKIVARAAYARTIGRPAFSEIIPTVVVSDPQAAEASRTITVSNPGLTPWSADNYDLSLELYQVKGAVASVGVFRKDLQNFFGSVRTAATTELLSEFNLGPEYLGYDVVTKRNFGAARLTGVELSWRQNLNFLPAWANGLAAYGNVTSMDLSGPNAGDFNSFSRRNINWGLSYVRPRFLVKLNVAQSREIRQARVAPSATVPADVYTYIAPKTTVDLSLEYRFMRNISAYGSIRNLTNTPRRNQRVGPGLPAYVTPTSYSYYGNLFTVGLRGDF